MTSRILPYRMLDYLRDDGPGRAGGIDAFVRLLPIKEWFGRNKRLIARMRAPATTAQVLPEIDLEIGMPLISPARRLIAFQGTAVRDPVWLWQESAARSDGCPRCGAIAQRVAGEFPQ
jgi:hypothetical protein